MTQTPAIAAALANNVARLSRSPSHTRSIAAVRNGAVAKMITTSATEVSRNALMNMIVASAEQAAATSPGSPIARTAVGASRPSWHTNTAATNPPANSPRQNRIVHTSSGISRVKNPAVL